MRRVAAHEVIVCGNGSAREDFRPGVVEIEGDEAARAYKLPGELPRTEWLGGTIEVKEGKAYHAGMLLKE